MNEVNENEVIGPGDEFWRGHVLAAQEFMGKNFEYCAQNNLDHRRFSYHKRRLGFGKPRKNPKVFVEVKKKSTNVENSAVTIEIKRKLPDAKWVAEFISSLMLSFGK